MCTIIRDFMLFLALWERAHLVTCEHIVQLSYMFLGMHYVWNNGSPSVVKWMIKQRWTGIMNAATHWLFHSAEKL